MAAEARPWACTSEASVVYRSDGFFAAEEERRPSRHVCRRCPARRGRRIHAASLLVRLLPRRRHRLFRPELRAAAEARPAMAASLFILLIPLSPVVQSAPFSPLSLLLAASSRGVRA